jgi:hypothetical protein
LPVIHRIDLEITVRHPNKLSDNPINSPQTMVSAILIVSIVIAVVAAALGGAYMAGMLDQVIEKIGIYLFKAEAKAEKKKLEAQGLKEGEDFFEGE